MQESAGTAPEQDAQGSRKSDGVVLFFGNVPWNSTADDVKAAVKEKCGLDVDAKISTKKGGRSRGYATVRVSEEDAQKLIQMSEKVVIGERAIKIDRRRKRSRRKNNARGGAEGDAEEGETKNQQTEKNTSEKKEGVLLFFGNVPWNSTADQVNEKIKEHTNLECDVRISKRGSGRSRGYATVRVTPEQAEQLKEFSEKIIIGGRAIRIEQKKRRVPRKKRPAQEDAEENTSAAQANE